MSKIDYTAMWKSLGIDLKAHDSLLAVLQSAYADVYLSQKSRPQGMAYFDFVVSEIHGLRVQELLEAKQRGAKVVGVFCLYVPEEIIRAAGGVCVGLCAGAEVGTQQAEQVLPRNTCALIKSFVGFKLARLCPYIEACDLVVGETTCDGKKKAYEIFGELQDTLVIETPHTKSDEAQALWRSEIGRLTRKIEELSGQEITAHSLRESVRTVNAKRAALQRLNALRRARPSPVSGRDALLINQVQFYDDPARFTAKLNELCDELEERVGVGVGVVPPDAPRVLVSGCPMAAPNWKVPFVVEGNGASIVGEESCVGERGTRNLVTGQGETRDAILDQIAERYLQIDCACFTPNTERMDHILQMVREYEADGVIHYAIQFCAPYTIEVYKVQEALKQENIPLLKLETDYSMEDVGQLDTRVQAFLELLREQRAGR